MFRSPLTVKFKEDGFCVMRGLVDPAPLQDALAEYLVTGAPFLRGRAINYAGTAINSMHDVSAFDDLLYSDLMMELASNLLGESVMARAAELFAKPAKVGLPSPWHQDNAYWCLEPASGLTIWVALDACDWRNGGLTYLVGSHKTGLVEHEPSFAPGSSQTIANELLPPCDVCTPALMPGDALVHHCLTVHGSGPNTSEQSRRGLTLQYQGVSAKVNEEKLAAYEASLIEQIKGRA